MSDFQCKFYLLDGAETLECKEGNAEYVIKIADRPFPDSLLSFVYYDINSMGRPRFHEAERCIDKVLSDAGHNVPEAGAEASGRFQGRASVFFLPVAGLERPAEASRAADCKNPTKLLPHKELAHVPSNLATMQQQILRLFQTVSGRKHHRC